MQPVNKKNNISKPSRTWRKKYECKVTKGKHTFEITLPNYTLPERYRKMSTDEYYRNRNEEYRKCKESKEGYCFPVIRYYKCSSCGKIKTIWPKENS